MLGNTKLSIHISVTTLNVTNSSTPINENKYTAIPPFITTSNINIEGNIDAKKYILVISIMAFR